MAAPPADEPGDATGEGDHGADHQAAPPPRVQAGWPKDRLELAEKVWGEGSTLPGGVAYTVDLARPLSLSASSSFLEFGSNLGGSTRAIADELGPYVTGKELDPRLAEIASERSHTLKAEKKAIIEPFEVATLNLRKGFFDACLAREILFAIEDKAEVINQIGRALKHHAGFVICDLVTPTDEMALEVRRWAEGEAPPGRPISVAAYKALFKAAGLATHIEKDETDLYVQMILSAWNEFNIFATKNQVDKALVGPLVGEIEFWARRVAALQSGHLRFYRFSGQKTAK
ncbi:MAG: methyltransferase domain-containing protein [Rhodospirillales bacterium]